MAKFACMLLVSVCIFYASQGFVARVQYMGAVANRTSSIGDSIVTFVRRTFAIEQPSAFDAEQTMSLSMLLDRWQPLIDAASKRFGVPAPWLRTVMRMESGGRTMSGENQPITSRAGAMGLMQLMPATYLQMRTQLDLGANPYDPHDNIFASAAYLSWLHQRYGYPAMFAAYNDGPGNLEARLSEGKLLPVETRNYLTRIVGTLERGRQDDSVLKLTRPNGQSVEIRAAEISSVRAALPGEYAPHVRSVIAIGLARQGVCESVPDVKALLRAHGGIVGSAQILAGVAARSKFRGRTDASLERRKQIAASSSAFHCGARICARFST